MSRRKYSISEGELHDFLSVPHSVCSSGVVSWWDTLCRRKAPSLASPGWVSNSCILVVAVLLSIVVSFFFNSVSFFSLFSSAHGPYRCVGPTLVFVVVFLLLLLRWRRRMKERERERERERVGGRGESSKQCSNAGSVFRRRCRRPQHTSFTSFPQLRTGSRSSYSDGSIVALSSGTDHVEIKVLKLHWRGRKRLRVEKEKGWRDNCSESFMLYICVNIYVYKHYWRPRYTEKLTHSQRVRSEKLAALGHERDREYT